MKKMLLYLLVDFALLIVQGDCRKDAASSCREWSTSGGVASWKMTNHRIASHSHCSLRWLVHWRGLSARSVRMELPAENRRPMVLKGPSIAVPMLLIPVASKVFSLATVAAMPGWGVHTLIMWKLNSCPIWHTWLHTLHLCGTLYMSVFVLPFFSMILW
jgi:hypothetical protein